MSRQIKRLAVLMLTLTAIALFCPVSADDVASAKIDNTAITPTTLELYLSTNIKEAATKDNVSVSLGGTKLKIQSVEPFNKSGEGVTYLFLVDESGSMKSQMDNVKGFVKGVVSSMGAADKAAIVTVADTTSQGAFTSDKNALTTQADAMAATNQDTNLYRGITTCIDMFATYQSQITSRRALIILSDGDEDFSSGITKDEVLTKISGARLPIFTYAMLPANPSNEQISSSKIFGSFARGSAGGIDFTNAQAADTVAEAVTAALQNSYAVKAELDAASFAGKNLYLEASLNSNGLSVKDGYNLQVSVTSTASSAVESSSSTGSTGKGSSTGGKSEKDDKKPTIVQTLLKPQVLFPSIGGVLLVLALIIVLVVIRGKKKRVELAAQASQDAANITQDGETATGLTVAMTETPGEPPAYIDSEASALTSPAEQSPQNGGAMDAIGATVSLAQKEIAPPKPSLSIRLVNISANSHHDVYERVVEESLIIGRDRLWAQLVFDTDVMMSGRHCQLSYTGKKLLLGDLGSTNGTFVNGVPITELYALESDDVISVGSTEMRVIFENVTG